MGYYQQIKTKFNGYRDKGGSITMHPHYQKLTAEEQKGIIREYRAFLGLPKQFKDAIVIVASTAEDFKGVDLILFKGEDKYTIQVGGTYIKDFTTDYFVSVTNTRIYLYKNKNI